MKVRIFIYLLNKWKAQQHVLANEDSPRSEFGNVEVKMDQ